MRTSPLVLCLLLGCSAGRGDEPIVPTADSGSTPETAVDTGAAEDAPGFSPDTTPKDDMDGDGYRIGEDCDDGNPAINPGAIEVPGDGVDNDCNGKIDEPLDGCDEGLALETKDATDLARALGLCATTTADAKGKDRKWGVISAKLATTDGKAAPLARQYGVQELWGPNVGPRAGKSLAVLSSGVARTPGQPGYVALPKGTDSTTNQSAPPAGWPKNTKGCPVTKMPYAYDSVVLELVIRTPTNAKAFSFEFDFYSSEYVEYVCQPYNDTFVALLDSKVGLDPARAGNVSFDAAGDPINVNSGFFEACLPDSWLGRSFTCPRGTKELEGTGFDAVGKTIVDPARNGATGWLRTKQAIVPGETVTLRFAIWNTGDHWLPSTVLLDRFEWSADPTSATVTERPK
ncbi:MAG: putative metal-binding motif-containing protein [Myxococcales bacterium]|nr:putative metal-binding motif-containing protein [Myxococcales bacterium]